MKTIILTSFIFIFTLALFAQNPDGNYNPYVNGGVISPSPLLPLQVNGSGIISFNIGNTGSDPLDVYSGQFITLTITLSYGVPDNANPLAAVGGSSAGLFSWSYNAGSYTASQISAIPANSSGTITIAYKVNQNSLSPGSNGFNVNITPAPYQTTSNTQNDDAVSSYTYTELRDFGDAPASYGSADHILDFTNYLGTSWDGESSYLASANADGDDASGQDDEDGVVFPALIRQGATINIPVTVTGIGYLNAWIDWNGDGDFADAGERVATNVPRFSGAADLTVNVPAGAVISAPTFARFRFTPSTISSVTGSENGGEVEDYRFTILCSLPVPTLTSSDNDNSFCAGTNITFTAGGGTNYNFRVGGSTVQNSSVLTYSTTELTNGQLVDVIVTGSNGCTAASGSITNTVLANPTANAGIVLPAICQGSSTLALGGSVGGSATGGTWSSSAGGIFFPDSITLNATWTPPAVYNGTATLTLTSRGGQCGSVSSSKSQLVNPKPVVSITNPAAVCSPSTVNLTNSSITVGSTAGLAYSYWTDPAGSNTYATPAAATSGTYYIRGTIPATGCSDIRPVTVIVNATPATPVVSVTDNCNGTSSLSTSAGGSLLWSTGASTPGITVNTAGTYTVTSTLNACTSSAGSGIAAPKTAPGAPVVSNASPVNICPGLTINLVSLVTSSTPVGGSILYKTSNNPLGTNVSTPSSVGNGTYYLFYQNQAGCYSTGTEVIATINSCPPDLTPTLIVNPNIMHGITSFNLTVRVTELNMVNTSGTIVVNIPKDSRWTMPDGYVPSLTIIGSTNLNNSAWSYSSDAINHIFTSSAVIPAGTSSTYGFRVSFNPGSTRGIYTITSQLVSGGGGEVRVSNNVDSERIDYFQQ